MGVASTETHPKDLHRPQIRAQALIHDQTHLEIRISYPIPASALKHNRFKVDFFFFVPKSMGITWSNYSRDQFYHDLMNQVRIQTPPHDSLEWQLLGELSQAIDQLLRLRNHSLQESKLIESVKIFANTLNTRLKEDFAQFKRGSYERIQHLFDIDLLLQSFRKGCVEPVDRPTLNIPSELKKTIFLVDEYLSNRVESIFAEINGHLEKAKSNRLTIEIRYQILRTLEKEIEYRKTKSDRLLIKNSSESEKEYFYYRQNLLKRFITHPLYLTVEKTRLEQRYRNIIASFAAALAAAWAQLATLHAYPSPDATDMGLRFFTVASVAIVIYVFKDRIKDLSKEYVNEKLKGKVPDYKGSLSHSRYGKLAQTTEYLRILDENTTSSEIRFLRRLESHWDIERPLPDTVLHYHRTLALDQDSPIKTQFFETSSLQDFFRFNLKYFLKHLDDPIKPLAIYDSEDGATWVHAPKVYHINLVLRMTSTPPGQDLNQRLYEFSTYRLIFNKTGMIRLEALSEEQLNYKEENYG